MDYKPLDFSEFETRLLQLLRPYDEEDDESDIIECRLIQGVSLVEPPEYYGVSYCWGDAAVTKPLVVDGHEVQVTSNLEAALRELRRTIGTCDLFWVDALCINQADLYERSYQVSRMGLIFASAMVVLAWLGPADADSDFAIDFVCNRPSLTATDQDRIDAALQKFGERPFWKRVWIIQELAKAKDVYLHCGRKFLHWRKFVAFTSRCRLNELARFRQREQKDIVGSERVPLATALMETRRSLASDPRDKIYALLGLTADGMDLVPLPNYLQTTKDIYLQLSHNIIVRQQQVSTVLLAPRARNHEVHMPSWTPYWSSLGDTDLPPWLEDCTEPWSYPRKHHISVTDDNGLRLQWRFCETILACFSTSPVSGARCVGDGDPRLAIAYVDNQVFVRQLFCAISWNGSPYSLKTPLYLPAPRSRRTPRLVSDVWDLSLNFHSAAWELRKKIFAFTYMLLNKDGCKPISAEDPWVLIGQWMEENGRLKIAGKTVRERLEEEYWRLQHFRPSKAPEPRKFQDLADNIRKFVRWKMRLVITDHAIRTVYCDTQVGDKIALLSNCHLPVVLRDIELGYQYIGETALVNERKLGKSPWKPITIY